MVNEEDYLMLSGIQHFEFCKRQWALIHIEQQWEENVKTIEGQYVHRKVDQPFIKEKRKDNITVRAMPIKSEKFKITGICDVVEFIKSPQGVYIPSLNDKYIAYPVEYKRGKPKKHDSDILQLVLQAICLEEMLLLDINYAFLYYNEIKRRVKIEITDKMREQVENIVKEMHFYYMKRYTPKVKTGPHCKQCSLKDICLPEMMGKQSVQSYIERKLKE